MNHQELEMRSKLKAANFPTQQATECERCNVYKHTPWRDDKFGYGYVCATCLESIFKEDQDRLDWLLDYITQNGADGIAALQWTVVDTDEIMEDRTELRFDRDTIDAATQQSRRAGSKT